MVKEEKEGEDEEEGKVGDDQDISWALAVSKRWMGRRLGARGLRSE